MDADKLERLIQLECEGYETPELNLLRAWITAEELERHKRDPLIISAEITKSLETACFSAVAGLHGKVSCHASNDPVSGRWEFAAVFAATTVPVFRTLTEPFEAASETVMTRRLAREEWAFAVADIQIWRTKDGERGIRGFIEQIARLLAAHVSSA